MVILAGRKQNTDNGSFGVVLFNAETVEEAREIVLNDPAVKEQGIPGGTVPLQNGPVRPC